MKVKAVANQNRTESNNTKHIECSTETVNAFISIVVSLKMALDSMFDNESCK